MSKAPDLQMIFHTSLVSIKYFCVQLYSVTNVSLTQFLKFTRILMQPCNIFQQIVLPSSGTELHLVMAI
jgi:hypothetical protein